MDIHERIIQTYRNREGQEPFQLWLQTIDDQKTKQVIDRHIEKIKVGNFSQAQPVGRGVHEIRIFWGPGYRIYFGNYGHRIIILLLGGDKSTQNKDIQLAHDYWEDFKRRMR